MKTSQMTQPVSDSGLSPRGVSGCSIRPAKHTAIQVRPFLDARSQGSHPQGHVRPFDPQILLSNARGPVAAGSGLVTRVFANALRRAGYHVAIDASSGTTLGGSAVQPIVLVGRIWSFNFQTHASTLLEVDVSISLWDGPTAETVWRMDFPAEDDLPFWIGLGCKPEEMAHAALREVEEAALLQFQSNPFRRAAGWPDAAGEPAPSEADTLHRIVAAPSWTATDQGEITATAHESMPASGSAAGPAMGEGELVSHNSHGT